MTDDHSRRRKWTLRAVALAGGRVLVDLLILGLWVVFLGLLFLSTGWPRWGFYTLLVLGIVLYVQVTAAWLGSSEPDSDSSSTADRPD